MSSPRALMLRFLALLTALLALSGPAFGSATSGTIKGVVVDDGGLSVPGALITLSSPQLIGGAQQRTTDEDGNFIFLELPPGRYDLNAQKQGFGPVRKAGIEVLIGRVTTVNVEMKYGGAEVVIEEKRKVVDTEKVSTGNTFNSEYLSRIPSGRTYQDVVGQTAGVIGGANSYSQGAANDENTYLLDGVNVTDPVTGTFSNNFNFDAIEEIEVITGAFDPEYGDSLGATISTVTKSGGNTLETIFGARYFNDNWSYKQDARFTADGYTLYPTDFDSSGQGAQIGAFVSGPVVRDRVWFAGSYEFFRTLYQNVGIPLPRDYEQHSFWGKLTTQPSSSHRITLSFSTDPTTVDNTEQSDKYTNPEAQARQYQVNRTGFLTWNWFINPEANLETQAKLMTQTFLISQVPCTHDESLGYNACDAEEPDNHIDYTTVPRAGYYGAYNSQNFSYFLIDHRYSGEVSSKFSLVQVPFYGKHDIKIGVDVQYTLWDQTYGYPGNMLQIDLYDNAYDPDTYANWLWLETSGLSQYQSDGYYFAGFVQDVYKPVDNLTFRGGFRYNHSIVNDDSGEPVMNSGVLQPRIYASWDPWADEKTKIYGGYGRVADSSALYLASYLSESGYGEKDFAGEYYGESLSSADNNFYENDTSNSIVANDDLSLPHTDQVIIGLQREVITDVAAKVEFTGKFTRNVYSFDETNLIYDEDGYGYIGTGNGEYEYLYRLRSPSIARRDYFQVDLGLDRSFAQRWQGGFTYSYVVSRGTAQYAGDASLANPSQVEYAYGNLPTDFRHQIKSYASWDLPNDPWTTQLGFYFVYYSGDPVTRYYYSASGAPTGDVSYDLLKAPIGTYARYQDYSQLDLLLKQDIPVDKGALAVEVTASNVLGTKYPTTYYSGYVNYYNRYITAYTQDSMSLNLGVSYEF